MKDLKYSALFLLFLFCSISLHSQASIDCDFLILSQNVSPSILDADNNVTTFLDENDFIDMQLVEDEIYFLESHDVGFIRKYDLEGNLLSSIAIDVFNIDFYYSFLVINSSKIALFDQKADLIHFIDGQGKLLTTIPLLNAPDDDHWQSMEAVVYGDEIIISENAVNELIGVNYTTYDSYVFYTLDESPLFSIEIRDDNLYISSNQNIYIVKADAPPAILVTTEDYNITDMVIVDKYLYFVTNFGGKIYEVDLETEEIKIVTDQLIGFPYKLIVTDSDCGKVSSGIKSAGNRTAIDVYPNPTSDFLFVKTFVNSFTISIVNSLGQVVLESKDEENIDVSSLISGQYTLIIRNQDTNELSQKLVQIIR